MGSFQTGTGEAPEAKRPPRGGGSGAAKSKIWQHLNYSSNRPLYGQLPLATPVIKQIMEAATDASCTKPLKKIANKILNFSLLLYPTNVWVFFECHYYSIDVFNCEAGCRSQSFENIMSSLKTLAIFKLHDQIFSRVLTSKFNFRGMSCQERANCSKCFELSVFCFFQPINH